VAGAAGTTVFLVVFHRAIALSLSSFLAGVVARPMAAAVIASVLAWLASGAPWSDPAAWDRARAAGGLAAGGAVMLLAAVVLLSMTRALTPGDVRDLVTRLRVTSERA